VEGGKGRGRKRRGGGGVMDEQACVSAPSLNPRLTSVRVKE